MTEVMTAPPTVTERAAKHVVKLVAGEAGAQALRISVDPGGCSGFQYKFDLVSEHPADDLVLERAGAKVAIDRVSLPYLAGAEIDYVEDLMSQAFKIKNPTATASCGCGTSFAV
jgi:iron-sulfur cluster assembly accessory protein